jgi:class 3 adenylate cyclase
MEPSIQYARAKDGTNVAFWTIGQGGRPLVLLPSVPFNHVQLSWELEGYAHTFERLSQRRMLISYDARGSGLSDRDVEDLTLEGYLQDLEAVLDKVGVERADLFAFITSGPIAVAYAARRPERVDRLLLWCSFARAADVLDAPQFQGLLSLADKDWTTFTEAMASVVFGWAAGEPARKFAAYMRACTTPEHMALARLTLAALDVSDQLPDVRARTLVMHRRNMVYPSVEGARYLASHIPNARLAIFDGDTSQLGVDSDRILDQIEAFLAEGSEDVPEGANVILFADIVNSTALTEELGDAAFRERARQLDAAMRTAIRSRGGTPIEGKLLGDGVLAVFRSGHEGIDAAIACRDAAENARLQLHIGLHAGDIIREANNVYGGAVNIAARIASAAVPGEILVSDTLRGLARTSAAVKFEDRGRQELKGVSDAQQLWAVSRR